MPLLKEMAVRVKIMTCNPDKYCRHSIRLKAYDYSQAGAYFVTICAHNRECVFGNVVKGEMRLNKYGRVVEAEWIKTANIRNNVELDVFVVMPNHLHGVLVIVGGVGDMAGRGTARRAPTGMNERFGKPTSGSLPTIVRSFKSAVTKRINELRCTPETHVWQRNYYEHVIRDEWDLNEIREYIMSNPLKWEMDRENPENLRQLSTI